jgi:hypothetical protein
MLLKMPQRHKENLSVKTIAYYDTSTESSLVLTVLELPKLDVENFQKYLPKIIFDRRPKNIFSFLYCK